MTIDRWRRRIDKAVELGIGNILMCFVTRLRFRMLRARFHFDPWHCDGTWYCRPYQRVAVDMVNRVSPSVVVEVGCGLGEVISRVSAPIRTAFDLDRSVIDAARHLRGNAVQFQVGSWADVGRGPIDVLVAINWIHSLSPEELSAALTLFEGRVSYFLLEGITVGQEGYAHCHDFAFLKGRAVLVDSKPGGIGEPRTLKLFKTIEHGG